MANQVPSVLSKFDFLESILNRYKSNSYKQLYPLVDNPQTLHESFDGKTKSVELYAVLEGYGEICVLLSELTEWDGKEIRSWFSVGFKKNDSEEMMTPTFDRLMACPFCNEKTYFTTGLPLDEMGTLYHCKKGRNFFELGSVVLRFSGLVICLLLAFISLFSFAVGLYIFVVNIWNGLFINRFTFIATIQIAGGAAILFLIVKKMWLAITQSTLKRVSDFEMYSIEGK